MASAENELKNWETLVDRVCATTGMSINKMEKEMGSNGIKLKNNELYKKIEKLNEQIEECENNIEKEN